MSSRKPSEKYRRMYWKFCADRKTRETPEGYTESHHIVPRHVGGSNDKSNLVRLTAREHYIAHLLYARGWETVRAWSAVRYMTAEAPGRTSRSTLIYNSRLFEVARLIGVNRGKDHHAFGKPGWMLGKTFTPLHRENIARSRVKLKLSESHKKAIGLGRLGKKHSEESKKKMSENNPMCKNPEALKKVLDYVTSDKHRETIRASRVGKTWSDEVKKKMSEARKTYWAKRKAAASITI